MSVTWNETYAALKAVVVAALAMPADKAALVRWEGEPEFQPNASYPSVELGLTTDRDIHTQVKRTENEFGTLDEVTEELHEFEVQVTLKTLANTTGPSLAQQWANLLRTRLLHRDVRELILSSGLCLVPWEHRTLRNYRRTEDGKSVGYSVLDLSFRALFVTEVPEVLNTIEHLEATGTAFDQGGNELTTFQVNADKDEE